MGTIVATEPERLSYLRALLSAHVSVEQLAAKPAAEGEGGA